MEQFTAPFGQTIELRHVFHDSGIGLLRLILREGGRYQVIDLDPGTAYRWGQAMVDWAVSNQQKPPPEGPQD
ncbi:MAG TPA: hypothetical protein VKA76_01040 [Gammaproteobacteria bacterium]|nr:hypothetical protein [Gammaproteobacteria bacterium]